MPDLLTAPAPPTDWITETIRGVKRRLPPVMDDGLMVLPTQERARPAKDLDPSEPVIEIVGSTEWQDSYNTAFVQAGMRDDRFRDNPVFLNEHGHVEGGDIPLGTAESWWREDIRVRVRVAGKSERRDIKATVFRIRFDVADDPDQDDELQRFNRMILDRYQRKVIRGASISFEPDFDAISFGDELSEKERNRYGITEHGILFRKWELVHLSKATQPSNAYALVRSRGGTAPGACACKREEVITLRADVDALKQEVAQLTRSTTRAAPPPAAPGTTPDEGTEPAGEAPGDERQRAATGGGEAPLTDDQLAQFARALRG